MGISVLGVASLTLRISSITAVMCLQISDQLKALQTPLSMSSKRIKRSVHYSLMPSAALIADACVCRLNAGALFILWVQIGQEPGDLKVHGVIHATLQGLIAADVTGSRSGAVIVSVSTAGRVSKCCLMS